MTNMRLMLCLGLLSVLTSAPAMAQQEVEDFIISVVSNYKNPMAYYPLRQDIFLPSEKELDEIEKRNDKPQGSEAMGSFVFVKEGELNREPFINAQGSLMFQSTKYKGLSNKAGYEYSLRRHQLILNKNKNLGKFLWYNQQFKELN